MLTDGELQALQRLARLDVPAERRDQVRRDLADILGHMEELGKVDTSGVKEVGHPLGLVLPTRVDQLHAEAPANGLDRSPNVMDGQLRVPRVME